MQQTIVPSARQGQEPFETYVELTAKALARQDLVDTKILELCRTLIGPRVDHNIELIGEVRDALAIVAERFGMSHQDFYPGIDLHSTPEETDGAEHVC